MIANYLLVKNDCTYMYISGFNGQQQDYGRLIIFPEYFIKIGHSERTEARPMMSHAAPTAISSDAAPIVISPVRNDFMFMPLRFP